MKKHVLCLLSALFATASMPVLFVAPVQAEESPALTAPRKPVLLEGKTSPLRVFARPTAKVYGNTNDPAVVAQENIPAFRTFYVYSRPAATESGNGWYEVGKDAKGSVVGWMKSGEVVEARLERDSVVLVTRHDLDSLNTIMKGVIEGVLRSRLAGMDLLESIFSLSINVEGDVKPRKFKNLGESGFLPAVLNNHPGRSRLMELSDEIWSAWTEDQQDEYLNWLNERCQDFAILCNQRTGWIRKNAGDDIDKAVYPIPGELLP